MRISRPSPVASFVAGAALLAVTSAFAGALTVAGPATAVGLPRPGAPSSDSDGANGAHGTFGAFGPGPGAGAGTGPSASDGTGTGSSPTTGTATATPSSSAPSDGAPTGTGPAAAPAAPATPGGASVSAGTPAAGGAYGTDRLTVTYGGDIDGPAGTYALRCNPAGGGGEGGLTQADVERACLRLAELGGPVGPVPDGQMCSMIYGGPQTAQVTGVWQGRKVHEEYRRTNGCEVARWGRMVPVLPAAVNTLQRGDLRG